MSKLPVCKNGRRPRHGGAGMDGLDRRALLAAAGTASLGLVAAPGLLGAFSKSVLAADKVTTMGFDHPYNFVTYVSDIQRWATVYAEAHGLKALFTSDNGKLDAQIANLETWIVQGVPAICCFPIRADGNRKNCGQGAVEGHRLGELRRAHQEPG